MNQDVIIIIIIIIIIINGDSCCFFANPDEGYNCKQTVLKTRIKKLSSNC